jgi:outer membrane protein assembly factor BamA
MTGAAILVLAALLGAPGASGLHAQPAVQSPQPAAAVAPADAVERLADVRVHGNHTTPDEEVLTLAGLAIGAPVDEAMIEAARKRLSSSGRFEDVEIRKRYRSLEPGGDVVLIIVVREHPIPDETLAAGPAVTRPFRRLFASGMFLPILNYNDGYGFTYGARFSFVDLLGRGSRVSVPLSWGGTKRAAIEVERTFRTGPFDRILGGAAVWERTNPFYEIDENREEAWVEASRQLVKGLRASGHAAYGEVSFGAIEENTFTYGADLTFDTRLDPVFPRNAVFASAGWERLDPSQSAPVNRFKADARAYRGLVGQSVLSLRVQYAGADGRQPDYARDLLGGASTLRGYRAGSFSGDNLLGGSAELRIPFSSVMTFAKVGMTLFTDAGTTWDHGTRVADARFKAGGGAGFFLLASLFQLNLDFGFREGGGTRIHFTTGLQF